MSSMTKRAIYAGTFAPITLGHLNIIEQALHLFDELIIAVSPYRKDDLGLTQMVRMQLIQAATEHLSNITIIPLEGSLVQCAKHYDIQWLVRGLRNAQDFPMESSMAQMNHQLDNNLQTVFLITDQKYQAINATLVRQLIACKEEVSVFVPEAVDQWMKSNHV
jgi:pantetheine-phosphate adenylyltransferase